MRFHVRRSHRLPDESYEAHGSIWHITTGAADRGSKPFANENLATAICDWLDEHSRALDARIILYCLMPDHLHIVYQVDEGNVIKSVSAMKSLTTRIWWKLGGSDKLWQPSFHDHGIRESDDINEIVTYILDNPVRAGLVLTWEEYPFVGGELLEFEELRQPTGGRPSLRAEPRRPTGGRTTFVMTCVGPQVAELRS